MTPSANHLFQSSAASDYMAAMLMSIGNELRGSLVVQVVHDEIFFEVKCCKKPKIAEAQAYFADKKQIEPVRRCVSCGRTWRTQSEGVGNDN
jgi:DNA polymerase I-like protein with 3'-5' exonuclease and polymerase domains